MKGAPPPALDLRDDDQIQAQLRQLATLHVPEWQGDPNAKRDAGMMLLRIFARLMEIALKRLNKTPELNFHAFLNATGISLLPPMPAQVPLTFTLASGAPPVLLPQGTRAGTAPQGDAQPVDFETTADLTVISGTLVAAWTLDPGWDRYADHTALVGRSNGRGFTPFVGARRLSHALYLGDDRLLDFNRAKVRVTFDTSGNHEELSLLQSIGWRYISDGQAVDELDFAIVSERGRVQIVFNDALRQIDQTPVRGPSADSALREGVRSRWLQATPKEPLTEGPGVEKLLFRNVELRVSGENLLPELAFSNTSPVDITTAFQPFGDAPKLGDAFYLNCAEALAKPNVELSLTFEIARTQMAETPKRPVLKWEELREAGWTPFEAQSVTDTTESLSKSGAVTLRSTSLMLAKVNGKEGRWIRVRIHEGDYGKAAEYVEVTPGEPSEGYKLKEGTGNLVPPVVAKLILSYTAQATPGSIAAQNGLLLTEQTLAHEEGFRPFVAIQDLTPAIYGDTAHPSTWVSTRLFLKSP